MKIISHFQDAAQTRHRGVEPYSLQEVRLTPDMNIEYTRGFYVHHNGDLIGIVATAEGPVFFHNQDKYLLQEGCYSFLLTEKKYGEHFLFRMAGGLCVKNLVYARSDQPWRKMGRRPGVGFFQLADEGGKEKTVRRILYREGNFLAAGQSGKG